MASEVACTYEIAYHGVCGKGVLHDDRCAEHLRLRCACCGRKATRQCPTDTTMGFVCGSPICNACKHVPYGHQRRDDWDAIVVREDQSMPTYSVSPGDYVEIPLKGYVVYNAGGFIAITNSRVVYERSKSDTQAVFDRDKGEYYFDIPEHMIVREPERVPEYADFTLARVLVDGRTQPIVLEFKDGGWRDPNSHTPIERRVVVQRVLYNPEDDD